jgi:hypothetical protein
MVIQIVTVVAMLAAIVAGILLLVKALRRRRLRLFGLVAATVVLAGYLLVVNATALVSAADDASCPARSDGVAPAASHGC